MSEFLAISFDCMSSPSIHLRSPSDGSNNSGWGFGWYPNDEAGASILKDSSSKEANELATALSSWNNFRSTTFICKVKGELRRYTQQSSQPFCRSFGGRDWLFLHNGELDKKALTNILEKDKSRFLEPLGNTDSELAFCIFLANVFNSGKKMLSEIPSATIHHWFQELNKLGTADFVVSDGRQVAIFHGETSNATLSYARILPPNDDIVFSASDVRFELDDPSDSYRTMFVVTTCHFGQSNWSTMNPGQTLMLRQGAVQWSSENDRLVGISQSNVKGEGGFKMNIIESKSLPFSATTIAQAQSGPQVVNVKSIIKGADGRPLTFRKYNVRHVTKYVYDKEVKRSSHVLRLQPVEDQIQEIVKSTLNISVAGERLEFEDVFGNQSMHLTLENPYLSLEFASESEIKIYERPLDDFSSNKRQVSIPLFWMPWQRQMMSPYLLPPELPETQLRELTDFAMSFVERNDYNLIETLNDLNRRIFEDFNYVSGSTTLETSPFDVYTNRKGVCQDFANLFICITRLLNIPSRYRVGYLHTGSNYENKEQADASHAWAEVYLPYIGWRGFDPTNGCATNQDHIRVACGRNYRDATPTSGTIFKGGGRELLSVEVKVTELTT